MIRELSQKCKKAEFHTKETPCPDGAIYFKGMCYSISLAKMTFAEAEVSCLPQADEGGKFKSQLMWTTQSFVYDFISRQVEVMTGQTEFWVGLDRQNLQKDFVDR